ncbi:MAG: hydantoinase/oxoprolinase family protein [Candidatus Tectomicrobia bacterium]|nr:hydantoinase/oxoprolinase family protein [Candidatus Tectomicrobia bacterium]
MKRIAIDVGGTFTDCLVLDASGALSAFKSPTTPQDPTQGVRQALEQAAQHFEQPLSTFLKDVDLLMHGTTLATNTLINKAGAKTGMITTKNFRDLVEIRRGIKDPRVSMYNLFIPPYEPLVPRYLRLGVTERTLWNGEVLKTVSPTEVREAAEKLRQEGVQSIAVCFLHSYANPQNEEAAANLLRGSFADLYVCASHDILPVWGEYERFSTTLVDAYVGPVVSQYLRKLERELKRSGLKGAMLMILANGLTQTVEHCAKRAVFLIGSGPAAQPSAGTFLGSLTKQRDLLTMDMGGTSFDVCLLPGGEIPTTTEMWQEDHRVAIKIVDVRSIGAGGGSIAWIDSLGLLRVGPQSAGAEPGPACYNRGGTQPTVTDADLLLGYVPADFFLGGSIPLDAGAATKAVKSVAGPHKMSVDEAAEAIFTTVNMNMANQITEVSTKRGYDVRDFTLVAGGGAGAVHAAFIAEQLGIEKIIVPSTAALFSAFGMFSMDLGRDFARSFVSRALRLDLRRVNSLYAQMEKEARANIRSMKIPVQDVVLNRTAEMRYVRQFHQVEVEMPNGKLGAADLELILNNFHKRHDELFTFSMPWREVEFLTFRLKAVAPRAPFKLSKIKPGKADAKAALKSKRPCRFHGRQLDTPIYDSDRLLANNTFKGPAIIEEPTTTVVIPPGFACAIDAYKNYILTRR